MTDSIPVFDRRAVFVIDVQKYLISGPDAVSDAPEVRQAIGDILESIRRHNDLAQLNNLDSFRRTKIVFVQHDDKDLHDPLHKGKSTWQLEFNPRENDDAESLVSKDVRE
jgi:nicotinamidase-related amidase